MGHLVRPCKAGILREEVVLTTWRVEDGGWGGGKGEESYVTFSFLSQSGIIRCVHLSRCAHLLLDLTEEGGR